MIFEYLAGCLDKVVSKVLGTHGDSTRLLEIYSQLCSSSINHRHFPIN